ncbi:MAG: hypothetical protein ACRCU0_00220 [Candidatus Rhabdochlamydia sp.]
MFTQNTLQKELLDLIQQTTCLLKETSCSMSRVSPEDHRFFNPPTPKQPIISEIKSLPQVQQVKAKPFVKPIFLDRWPSIRSILKKIAPNMKLLDTVPDDFKAQKAANAWNEQTEVIIITGPSSNEELLFLKDLARAIHDRLSTTKLISGIKLEKENLWESFFEKNNFKLVIITEASQKYTDLMQYHKLAPTPLLILKSLETYKQPDQKTALWKSLCQTLTPAVSSP